MANTHTKLSARVEDPQYKVRGRTTGGKLHQRGEKKWKPETSPIVAKAMVVHAEKVETALEAKIVAALKRAEAMIVENRAVVAARQFARLEAVQYVKFVSAAEGARARLVAQGLIS